MLVLGRTGVQLDPDCVCVAAFIAPCQMSDIASGALIEMVTELLHPSNGSTVLRVGVAYISKSLQYYPALVTPFLEALLALPSDIRLRLLTSSGPKDELPVCGVSGGKYVLPCVAADWPAGVVLSALAALVLQQKLENLEQEHFEVLRYEAG